MRPEETNGNPPGQVSPRRKSGKRSPLLLTLFAVVLVVVPLLFWHGTWFGRVLSDQELEKYLQDSTRPRRIQHALSQIADRIVRGDTSVKPLYPRVIALAAHPDVNIRITAAWLMGQDDRASEFHEALLKLLDDREVMVRRNAALALVRFGDGMGRAELAGMLQPHAVRSPREGTVSIQLGAGRQVGTGTLLARVRADGGQDIELRSPFPGEVDLVIAEDGARAAKGDQLLSLRPDPSQAWEALRGLYLVGQIEDLRVVEPYTRTSTSSDLRRQAVLTAQAIRTRWEHEPNR
jgi:hypothetical protein